MNRVRTRPVAVTHIGGSAGGARGTAVNAGIEPFGSAGGSATGVVIGPNIIITLSQEHGVEAEALQLHRGLHEAQVLQDIGLAEGALVGDGRRQRGGVEDAGLAESAERTRCGGGFRDGTRSGAGAVRKATH